MIPPGKDLLARKIDQPAGREKTTFFYVVPAKAGTHTA